MAPIHHSCCKNFNAVYPVQNDSAKNGQLALMMNLFFKKKVRLEEIENCLKFPKSPQKILDNEIQAEIFNKVLEIQANKKVGMLQRNDESIRMKNSKARLCRLKIKGGGKSVLGQLSTMIPSYIDLNW